jgi:hypothetical protein
LFFLGGDDNTYNNIERPYTSRTIIRSSYTLCLTQYKRTLFPPSSMTKSLGFVTRTQLSTMELEIYVGQLSRCVDWWWCVYWGRDLHRGKRFIYYLA